MGKKILTSAFFLIVSISLLVNAQTLVTFSLNVKPLENLGCFIPGSGDKIIIRGNFNKWEGDKDQLNIISGDSIAVYSIETYLETGDTLLYKYILIRNDGVEFWERFPNPSNPPYGIREFPITKADQILPLDKFDHYEYMRYPVVFKKEKLHEDFIEMKNLLLENHPALYDYTNKNVLDSLFLTQYECLDKDLTFSEFHNVLATILSKIGCGHTKLWIPDDYWRTVPDKYFPLNLYFAAEKVFITENLSKKNDFPIGSELISINKIPISEIIDSLKSLTSADGFNDASKSKNVEILFAAKYALCYGFPEKFIIEYLAPDESDLKKITISPVSRDNVTLKHKRENELSLKILENNIALITINTFVYYRELIMFRNFIDSSFTVLKEKNTENLILDLRGNNGGDPFCSSYLFSYLEQKPLPYFEEEYGKYADLAAPIPVAENNFHGNLYTLIDGAGFSTTGHFCSLLKFHKIGRFIGSELGATFTCTGNVKYKNLDNTRITLGTAKERRYSAAVKNMDLQRGVLPDYQVMKNQNDIIEGRDTVLDFTINLINQK